MNFGERVRKITQAVKKQDGGDNKCKILRTGYQRKVKMKMQNFISIQFQKGCWNKNCKLIN